MLILPQFKGSGGYVRIDRPEGPPIERETNQCVHCMAHYVVQPGSGRRRGWCTHCAGPLCGAERCFQCVPFMKKVEGEAPW